MAAGPRALVAGLVYCPFFVWAMTVNSPLAAGVDDYAAKPFELAELAAMRYRVLPPR